MAEEYIITLKHAELIRISDTAKDPFCKVRYSHQEYKTKICKGVPKVPIWNETFRLKKVKMIDTIVIEVYDMESPIKNELLGSGIFSLNTLKFKKNVHTYQEIALKVGKADKIMGKVFFEIEYTREGIESEQEKEHKVLKGSEKKEPEEEKQVIFCL